MYLLTLSSSLFVIFKAGKRGIISLSARSVIKLLLYMFHVSSRLCCKRHPGYEIDSLTSEILTIEQCSSMKQTAFTRKKDFGKEAREAQWAHAQRTLHGLHPTDANQHPLSGGSSNRELGFMAEQAKRRAEIARYVLHS